MKRSLAQLFSGAGLGLMLGVLLGLSSAPVVAVVVGAIAALLGSLVLPQLPAKSPQEGSTDERRVAIDLRAGAFGLACVLGVVGGIWLRTHDALSPKQNPLKEKLEQWQSIGFEPEEARVLVARSEGFGPAASAPVAPATGDTALTQYSVLFGDKTTRCAQLSVDRYASVEAAAQAYEALGEPLLERIAKGLSRLPDPESRMAALTIVVEASCNGG